MRSEGFGVSPDIDVGMVTLILTVLNRDYKKHTIHTDSSPLSARVRFTWDPPSLLLQFYGLYLLLKGSGY